jgi:hypothetical protein
VTLPRGLAPRAEFVKATLRKLNFLKVAFTNFGREVLGRPVTGPAATIASRA